MSPMEHRTREILGRLCGWIALGLCAAAGAAAAACALGGLPSTLAMARARAALSDAFGRHEYYSFLYVAADPPPSRRHTEWFWLLDGGRLVDSPTGSSGRSLYRYAPPWPELDRVDCRPNPYAGIAPPGTAWSWMYPAGTRLVLVDTALDLDAAALGRLADAAGVPRQRAGWLATSADDFYMLRRGRGGRPSGMLLTGFDFGVTLDASAREARDGLAHDARCRTARDDETAVMILQSVRGFLKTQPVLVTADAALADAARQTAKVVLVDAAGADTLDVHHAATTADIPTALAGFLN